MENDLKIKSHTALESDDFYFEKCVDVEARAIEVRHLG